MGREIQVDRLDFMKDGSIVINECDDRYICGRTDFTNDIARLFYNRDSTYLIVDYEKGLEGKHHFKFKSKTFGDIDDDFATISLDDVLEVCDEYIRVDEEELAREDKMLEDAYMARRNAATVKDFSDFSNLIDNLEKHRAEYCESAKLYKKYITTLNLCHNDDVACCYALLTLSE